MKDNEIIDFVIPWVDGADPVWQAEREARAKQIGKEENCDCSERKHAQKHKEFFVHACGFGIIV